MICVSYMAKNAIYSFALVVLLNLPHVLVNSNACEGALQNPLEYTETDWEDTMTVNLKTPWLLTRAVARRMKSSGRGGSVIFVSYISGIERGLYPGVSVHGAAMAGLHQLTKVRKSAPIMLKDQFFMIFISGCLGSATIGRNGCI